MPKLSPPFENLDENKDLVVRPHDLSNNSSYIKVDKINPIIMDNFFNDDVGLLFDGKAAETYSKRSAETLNENTSTDVPHNVDKIP